MSLANEKDVLKLQQLGKQYAEDAIKFFGQKYSQKPEVLEVAVFYATATAALAEAMYAFMAANAEKEQADGWLVQLFSTIGQSMKMKQIAVPPADLSPLATGPGPCPAGHPGSMGTAGIPACVCKTDAHGICPTCPSQIKASIRKVLIPVGDCLRVVQQGIEKVGGEKSCQTCTEAYLDAATASVIMEGSLGELSPEVEPFADQVFEAVYQWAAARGVNEMGLTDKAWAVYSDRMADKAEAAE